MQPEAAKMKSIFLPIAAHPTNVCTNNISDRTLTFSHWGRGAQRRGPSASPSTILHSKIELETFLRVHFGIRESSPTHKTNFWGKPQANLGALLHPNCLGFTPKLAMRPWAASVQSLKNAPDKTSNNLIHIKYKYDCDCLCVAPAVLSLRHV